MAVLGSAFSHVIVWTPLPLPPFIRGGWNSCNGGDGKFLLEMGGSQEWGGWFYNRGDGKFLWRPPYIVYPCPNFKFCWTSPLLLCHFQLPLQLSCFFGWIGDRDCAILLNDNMDLHMSDLGTLVPKGPWCVFYATRCQVFWALTQCGILLVLWFDITHTHNHTNIQSTLRGP